VHRSTGPLVASPACAMWGRRNFASAMATLAGAFIACGGSSGGSTGSGPDASTADAPPPPNCEESGSSDAQPTDASADTATAAGDSGGDGSASCLGSVTFHIAAGTRATYCGQGPCGADFVTVLNASGQMLKIRELSSHPCSRSGHSSGPPVSQISIATHCSSNRGPFRATRSGVPSNGRDGAIARLRRTLPNTRCVKPPTAIPRCWTSGGSNLGDYQTRQYARPRFARAISECCERFRLADRG